MRLRTLLSLLIPLAGAALFVRLGVWQLERHRERSRVNSGLRERLALPPVAFDQALSDTSRAAWRRVSLVGRFRYDLEEVLAGRSSEGSPGVHLLSPLERSGTDTLVIVTRGWVYSPDAAAADLPRWREADSAYLEGYLVPIDADGAPPAEGRPFRTLNIAALSARLGHPVAPFRVVMTSDSAARVDSVPRRLPPPALDGGPHRSYAIQWFAFALIAIFGGALLFRRGIVADRNGG